MSSRKKGLLSLLIVAAIVWSIITEINESSEKYGIMERNNTFVWASLVKVHIREESNGSISYDGVCTYKVGDRTYTASYPGFRTSPPQGLIVPVFYNPERPEENTYLGESYEMIRNRPNEFYEWLQIQRKNKAHQDTSKETLPPQ